MALKRAWNPASTGCAQSTAIDSGRKALTPRTQAVSGLAASVSKCATCARACTPRSVRPAAVTAIASPAMAASAFASTSCTPPPPGCVCQPRKRLPSYSRPIAIREIREVTAAGVAELGEKLLGAAAVRGVALLHHFLLGVAGAGLVAPFLLGLREGGLGGGFLPLRVRAWLRRDHRRIRRCAKVEADRRQVELRLGGRRFGVLVAAEVEVEVQSAARFRGLRRRGSGRFGLLLVHAEVEVEVHRAGRFVLRTRGEDRLVGRTRLQCLRSAELDVDAGLGGVLRLVERNVGR